MSSPLRFGTAAVVCCLCYWAASVGPTHGVNTEQNATLSFMTFNSFLAFASATAARTNSPARLAGLQTQFRNGAVARLADVVCLQELQEAGDQATLRAAAREGGFTYSSSFTDDIDPARIPLLNARRACNAARFATLAGCLLINCDSVLRNSDIRDVLNCTISKCSLQFQEAGLSQECLNCLNFRGVQGILPLGQGLCFVKDSVYDHRPTYGLLLLSKYPLINITHQTFLPVPTLFSRGYIRANVLGGRDIGTWTAVCTHLYPDASGVPYSGVFGSAANENLNNTFRVLADAEVRANSRVAILGDMNHGPRLAGVSPEFNQSYALAVGSSPIATGYCSPYVTQVGQCTFCKDNLFLQAQGQSTSSILDHVYLKAPFLNCRNGAVQGNTTVLSATRVFDRALLSDHYGVAVTVAIGDVNLDASASTSTLAVAKSTHACVLLTSILLPLLLI